MVTPIIRFASAQYGNYTHASAKNSKEGKSGAADMASAIADMANIASNRSSDKQSTQNGQKSGRYDKNECRKCATRKYQDGSNDPGVSFKMPTKINPDAAAGAVKSHEMEHVFREANKAKQEGRQVVSQSVAIHTAVCPECGRVYVSGGTTRTVTKTTIAKEVSKIVKNSEQEKRILDAIA